VTTPLRLKPWGFYGLTPMHCSPSANRSFSLLDTLRVLRNRLPVPTSYTQLLKSRIGRTLSLFNFCRYISDRLFYYSIKAFHPLPLKWRGFHGLKPKSVNSYPGGVDLLQKRAILVCHMTNVPDDPLLVDPFPLMTCWEERGICRVVSPCSKFPSCCLLRMCL
jgi:hypothetical protein